MSAKRRSFFRSSAVALLLAGFFCMQAAAAPLVERPASGERASFSVTEPGERSALSVTEPGERSALSVTVPGERSVLSVTEPGSCGILLDESSVSGTPDRLLVKQMTYRTFDPKEDPALYFEKTAFLGNAEYRIDGFSAPVITGQSSVPAAGGVYLSEPFTGDGKEHLPEETREIDGVRMKLVSSRLIDAQTEERTEEQSVSYVYEGLEADTDVPAVREIEFSDANTGNSFRTALSLVSSETTDRYWSDSFSFPVHMENVQADEFELGDTVIPREDALIDHAEDLLRLLSLDPAFYEITSIEWTGEPYPDADGILCRDAVASGRKLLRDVSAVYGGTVTYPAQAAKAWECEYREIVPPEQSVIYTMSVDVTLTRITCLPEEADDSEERAPDRKGIISAIYDTLKIVAGKVIELIREHPAESVACLVVSAAFIVLLLMTKASRKCLYQKNVRCPYSRRTEEKCKTCVHRYQVREPEKGLFRPKAPQ